MNPELVKFHLPTTDQFPVAVDNVLAVRPANAAVAEVELKHPRPQEMSELTRIYESEPAWSR
jgi:hypothetical protein